MSLIRLIWSTLWRAVLVGLGYFAALLLVGMAAALLGVVVPSTPQQAAMLPWLALAAVLMGAGLGPLAARLPAERAQQALIWSSLIFFNMGSVSIEGALFAPALVPVPLPLLAVEQLAGALAAGGLIALLFVPRGQSADWATALRARPWTGWAWRVAAGGLGYVLFYWVFGALDYALVTQPYYASHAGGLTVPSAGLVLAAELVRGPLLVLSVWPLVLTLRATRVRTTRLRAMAVTGLTLFWIGGVVPLTLQIAALPALLLLASGVEIFCQNVLTGALAVWLLAPPLASPQLAPGAALHPRAVA